MREKFRQNAISSKIKKDCRKRERESKSYEKTKQKEINEKTIQIETVKYMKRLGNGRKERERGNRGEKERVNNQKLR